MNQKPVLTKEIAYKALQDFFQKKPLVIFGTGTSCSVDTSFGMDVLSRHLLDTIPNHIRETSQGCKVVWQAVEVALQSGSDLETAMNTVQDEELVKSIIECTADFVAKKDQEHFIPILFGHETWPATSIFIRLVDGLPETDRILHVATPNYDLLAEYAFEHDGIPYITGFIGGVSRKLDWGQARKVLTYDEKIQRGSKINIVKKCRKHICLYKVHGSLNTFLLGSNIVENNVWIHSVPAGIQRVMITPGMSKYERLHQLRNELLGKFDEAVASHNVFLFLGFGFNDSQLCNDSLKNKLRDQKCPGLIITKDWNERIGRLLDECQNLWLVCKQDKGDDTRIFNIEFAAWLKIDNCQIWKLDNFTKEILGGQ